MTTVVYASIADAPAINAVFKTVVSQAAVYNQAARDEEVATYTPKYIAGLLQDDPKAVAICRIEGAIAGFVITQYQSGPIWIEWIGVHPDRRKHGVAETLVDFCLAEAKGRGGHKYWCDTRDENAPAIALFAKKGFEQKCRLENHWHGQNYIIWEKFLEG